MTWSDITTRLVGVMCAVLTTLFVYAIADQCQPTDITVVPDTSLTIMHTMKSLNMMRCQRACAYSLGCQKVAYNTTKKICHFLGDGSGRIPVGSALKYADKTVLEPSNRCISTPCGANSICSTSFISDTGYRCIPFDRADCKELKATGVLNDGSYKIIPGGTTEIDVVCDMTTDEGGWTVIQQRRDGSTNFYRNWTEYENGFGDRTTVGNYWIGLKNIHQLSSEGTTELYVKLTTPGGRKTYARYSSFRLDDATNNYVLRVSGYSGDAGDSLADHNGMSFSTFDNDHTRSGCSKAYKCSVIRHGAWWYDCCYSSNLNGEYLNTTSGSWSGMVWELDFYKNSMMYTTMMLRSAG